VKIMRIMCKRIMGRGVLVLAMTAVWFHLRKLSSDEFIGRFVTHQTILRFGSVLVTLLTRVQEARNTQSRRVVFPWRITRDTLSLTIYR
jgi:hypothetical protein